MAQTTNWIPPTDGQEEFDKELRRRLKTKDVIVL
jgi:hypothetical protein